MTITVFGVPRPQGSKRFVGLSTAGKGIMVESCKETKNWREAVKYAALAAVDHPRMYNGGPFSGPVRVTMVFTLPRPKSAKKGAVPSKKPDLSKLVRATEDALTDAGVWEDDARVVILEAAKFYPGDQHPGRDLQCHVLDRPGAVIVIDPA
jgi:Holliday junction resolvase RusA-like endonuclease